MELEEKAKKILGRELSDKDYPLESLMGMENVVEEKKKSKK